MDQTGRLRPTGIGAAARRPFRSLETVEDSDSSIAWAEEKESVGVRRTITLKTPASAENLWLRAAVAGKITQAEGAYLVGDYRMKIDAAARPVLRSAGGKMELLVPVKPASGTAKIIEDYYW